MSEVTSDLFPGWAPPPAPPWISRLKKAERHVMYGRYCRHYRTVKQLREDGLPHLEPIVVSLGGTPAELRKTLGKATWRKFHHASLSANTAMAMIFQWLKISAETTLRDSEHRNILEQILESRPVHLRRVLRALRQLGNATGALYAARNAESSRRSFEAVHQLYLDTVGMGVTINPAWSVRRLQREHDAAVMKVNVSAADPRPWAPPLVVEIDGITFTRLISDRDFEMESAMMRNCVRGHGYSSRSKIREIMIFRGTGAERLTVELDIQQITFQRKRDGKHTPGLKQIEGFAGQKASKEAVSAALNGLCPAVRKYWYDFSNRERDIIQAAKDRGVQLWLQDLRTRGGPSSFRVACMRGPGPREWARPADPYDSVAEVVHFNCLAGGAIWAEFGDTQFLAGTVEHFWSSDVGAERGDRYNRYLVQAADGGVTWRHYDEIIRAYQRG